MKLYHKYPTRELIVLANRGNRRAWSALVRRMGRDGARFGPQTQAKTIRNARNPLAAQTEWFEAL